MALFLYIFIIFATTLGSFLQQILIIAAWKSGKTWIIYKVTMWRIWSTTAFFIFSLLVRIASVVGGSCREVTLLLWHQLNEEEEAAADQELVD